MFIFPGSGEHLMKILLAKECADSVQNKEIPSEALQYVLNTKFIGKYCIYHRHM